MVARVERSHEHRPTQDIEKGFRAGIFLVGKNDIQTSTGIAQAYFMELKAPRKALFMFEKSGHQIHQDEPERFQNAIVETLGALPSDS
jgi:esterase/lipase